ncbi:fimbrial protein [Ralstonia sp. 22111]|uniref:fimbrial protein n=1 Tax=Ralstonia sp. 22111 TaxID=3453878 RepID=UPI003F8791AD
MKRLDGKTMGGIGRTIFAALILIAAKPALAWFDKEIIPPPALLSLPRNTPAGTVVARAYVTPQTLCGEASCRLTYFLPFTRWLVDGGSGNPTGPLILTELKGLNMQIIVNGKPQTKMQGESPVAFSTPIEVQWIRNNYGSPWFGNATATGAMAFWFFTKTMTGTEENRNYIKLKTSLTVIEGTCSVPSQTVELPSTRARSLTGIGTTAGERSFQIQINSCPKGYNKVLYRLKPVGDTVEQSPGVLPLSPDSTAKGVKIKVTDTAGAPAVFDTSIQVDDYNKATGGSFSIPMRVSYVQTEANVTPGTVNGAMSVLMEYQ